MPAPESGRTDQDDCRLAKRLHVIEMILSTDVFEEFYAPHGIISFFGPPGASVVVMLYNQFGGKKRLFHRIVTSFDAQDIHMMLQEPACTNASPTTDIQYTVYAKLENHVSPQIGTNAVNVKFDKATQVSLVARSAIKFSFPFELLVALYSYRWSV